MDRALQLAKEILEFAHHGDYSGGAEVYGVDEGRVRAGECLEAFQKRIDELESGKE